VSTSCDNRVAIFGGSFNPPHVGHVLAVTYVMSVFPVDQVLVVPVYQHAFGKELASFEARLEMARLAMSWIPGVDVSDIERRLGGESRTLYTIEALLEEDPKRALRLVIGADVLHDLPKWHRFDRIAELAPPIVIGRAGVKHPDAPPAHLPDVSSTQLRAAIKAGGAGDIETMMPLRVRAYIEAHRLYGSAEGDA
jgi:nicotinate-nucleotide adenylyltransferase